MEYLDVTAQLRDLLVGTIRFSGLSAARFGAWLSEGRNSFAIIDENIRVAHDLGINVLIVLNAKQSGPSRMQGGTSGFRPGNKKFGRPGVGRPGMMGGNGPGGKPGMMRSNKTSMPDLKKWKEFVRQVVERYNLDGVNDMPGAARPVAGYVVHNEPDYRRFWSDSGESYGLLVAETAKVIKETDKQAKVIFAGTAGTISSYLRSGEKAPANAPDSKRFKTRADINEEGMLLTAAKTAARALSEKKQYVDVVDFHFYESFDKWNKFEFFAKYIRRMNKEVGWSSSEIWSMETSTSGPSISGWNKGPKAHTEEEQAQSLVKRYVYGQALGISRIFWHALAINSQGPPGPFNNMALMVDNQPRLAYYAYRNLTHHLNGSDWKKTKLLKNGKNGVYLIQLWRSGYPMWVAWRE
jgi:hypothetical protein